MHINAGFRSILAGTIMLSGVFAAHPLFAQGFTLQQAMSAPFTSQLRAAPSKSRVVWEVDIDGRHNFWWAEPAAGGKWIAKALTNYTEDDGQDVLTPAWTPDGNAVVYVRGENAAGGDHPVPNPAWFPDGAKQQIWIINASGGAPRLIGEGRAPAVSPDSKSVAYLLHGQVYLASLGDPKPAPKQLLVTRGTAASLHWSPDGKSLAFVSERGDHDFIAVYNLPAKSVIYLDPSTDHDSQPVWSADSTHIAFLRQPSEVEENFHGPRRTAMPWSIRVADAATGTSKEIFHAEEGVGSAFRETASLQYLNWTTADTIVFPWERDGWLHLYSVPSSGGAITLLTPGNNFEVEHTSLSDDRKTLVFDSNQTGTDSLDTDRRHIWRLDFTGAAPMPQRVTGGEGLEIEPIVASNGAVVIVRSDARVPVRAAVATATGIEDLAPQLIPANFPSAQFIAPKQVIFPSTDGLLIHAQLFMPAGTGRHPAIVFYHGGSQRQMLLGWHYMEYYSNAYAMNQYLVSQGFIVLTINYRGGIGYGLNFREAANYGATGGSEFKDALAAGKYLQARADVDTTRIGCWGGSWGGYMTALSLARASDIFAAGVDIEGVHNWKLELSYPAHYDTAKREAFDQMAYDSSPIAYVDTWRSPVLLIHGDDDRNVPFSESVQLVEALRKQHVYFEELIFPDEIHDILIHRDWVRSYTAAADFFKRKLTGVPPAAAQ